jgi:hypothetical protein
MTTTPVTLTDRYVYATLRHLPARQRPEIERELRASIADATDDRVAAGTDPGEAERAVIAELGDPARLAAGYADRPLYLIGPTLFLDYIRLVTLLVAVVFPATAGGIALAKALDGDAVGDILGTAFGTAFTVAVHVVFWITVLFALAERVPRLRGMTPGERFSGTAWTPDSLPEPPRRRPALGELIAESVLVLVFAGLVLLSPLLSTERDAAGDRINLLSPWLWDTGVIYVFVALALVHVGLRIGLHSARAIGPLAAGVFLTSVATTAIVIWAAATDHILNPAFVAAIGWPAEVVRWVNPIIIGAACLSLIGTTLELVKTVRR